MGVRPDVLGLFNWARSGSSRYLLTFCILIFCSLSDYFRFLTICISCVLGEVGAVVFLLRLAILCVDISRKLPF